MTLDRNPDFGDVIETIVRAVLSRVHTGMPAVVNDYDEADQHATVQPVNRVRKINLDEDVDFLRIPPIPQVPVRHAQGGGQLALTFPVKPGDKCWLDFSERSMEEFLATGESDIEPASVRRFDLIDAVASVDLRSFNEPLENVPTDRVRLGQHKTDSHSTHGPTRIEITEETVGTPAKIFIGCDLTTGGIKAELLTLLDELLAALETSYVNTSAGPQPILYGTAQSLIALCTALRALLAQIKE